jgi:hypothetical protein
LVAKQVQSIPQGLNRLRKKAERMVKMKKTIPRRLKPVLIFAPFAARLKPYPFKAAQDKEFFRSL